MSELGRFLEVLYGPDEPFSTAQATMRQWSDSALAENASGGGRPVIGRKKVNKEATVPGRVIEEASLSVWISQPGRLRIEKYDKTKEQTATFLVVVNGDRWWHRDDQGHVEANEAVQQQGRRRPIRGLTEIQCHFERASLREYFVGLALQQVGSVQTAGRSCIRLRGVPRPGARLWPHWLPCGADEYDFHADAERGVLLYVAGRYGGEVFEISEVTKVTFDEPLDEGLFTYTPQPGEQIRPPDTIAERLTLQAAVARMPFTVLVPTRMPDAGHGDFEVMYHPPRLRSPRAYLTLTCRGDWALWINQSDSADPEIAGNEWEQLERDGKRMAISDPGAGAGKRGVALEQQGTHVTIWSDCDRERVIDVAASLVAASEVLPGKSGSEVKP